MQDLLLCKNKDSFLYDLHENFVFTKDKYDTLLSYIRDLQIGESIDVHVCSNVLYIQFFLLVTLQDVQNGVCTISGVESFEELSDYFYDILDTIASKFDL